MRPIKYRQRTQNYKVHYWGFIDGAFIAPVTNDGIDDAHKHSQEFTGLHDKNGKEIYEGDVIKGSYREGKIHYRNGAFYCFDEILYESVNEDEVKVIGNVYENPELINTKE